MMGVPTAIALVEKIATPPDNVLCPIGLPLARKVTTSESGGGPELELTLAVKVTDCP